jgi:hypothetical protein
MDGVVVLVLILALVPLATLEVGKMKSEEL